MAKKKQISILTLEDGTLDSISFAEFENDLPVSVKRVEIPQLTKEEVNEIKLSNLLIKTKAK